MLRYFTANWLYNCRQWIMYKFYTMLNGATKLRGHTKLSEHYNISARFLFPHAIAL